MDFKNHHLTQFNLFLVSEMVLQEDIITLATPERRVSAVKYKIQNYSYAGQI